MAKPADVSIDERSSPMPSSVDPVRDLSHTISNNGTNNIAPAPPPDQKPPKPHRKGLGWLWLILLAGCAYGGFRYWQETQKKAAAAAAAQEQKAAHRSVPVVAVPARVGDMPVYLRGLGT